MSTALAEMPRTKFRRKDVPDGKCLCDYCIAKCCRYFALSIESPTERSDYDFIRWYLLHDRATVFKDEEDWYLLVHTTCKHLQDDHRCGIYETRPKICREYSTKDCEFDDEWTYDFYLETSEQVAEYTEAVFGPEDGGIRSPKPALLPII